MRRPRITYYISTNYIFYAEIEATFLLGKLFTTRYYLSRYILIKYLNQKFKFLRIFVIVYLW